LFKRKKCLLDALIRQHMSKRKNRIGCANDNFKKIYSLNVGNIARKNLL
jgi:hypothetical protein